VAVFVADDLNQTFDLPVPVPNQLAVGRPRVAPLLWLLDEYRRYGIVQVNHREARLLTAYLGRPEMTGGLALFLDTSGWRRKDLMPSGASGVTEGSLRDAFEQRVEEHTRGFWREVAGQVEAWVHEADIERLVLGGDESAAAGFMDLLPPSLAERVVGTVGLPFFESEAQTLARVRPVAEAVERERERTLMDDLVTTAMKGGRAALGLADTLGALQQGQVMTLVAGFPVTGQAWQCPGCGLALAQDAGSCPVCGGRPEPRSLEGLLPLLAHRTDAGIELVGGEAATRLAEYEGVGAVLRF
jgi:hypothetical protein